MLEGELAVAAVGGGVWGRGGRVGSCGVVGGAYTYAECGVRKGNAGGGGARVEACGGRVLSQSWGGACTYTNVVKIVAGVRLQPAPQEPKSPAPQGPEGRGLRALRLRAIATEGCEISRETVR